MRKRPSILIVLVAALGCAGDEPPAAIDGSGDAPAGSADTAGGDENTFDHPEQVDVWALLDRLAEEGPPGFSSRVHSCPKMRYATLGRVLASRGVDVGATGALTAGTLWRDGDQSLGAPVFAARQRENVELTTATASKMFDIFVQAAPEIIANAESSPACGVPIFDGDGGCNPDGLTCLLGQPATPGHVSLCNEMVARASTPEKGRVIAVAAIAAAGHTCE
jgi:hypothetical protein